MERQSTSTISLASDAVTSQGGNTSWEGLPHSLPNQKQAKRLAATKRPRRGNPSAKKGARPALARYPQPAFVLPEMKAGTAAERRRRNKPIKRAAILTAQASEMVEAYILQTSRSVHSDLLKFRLSRYAGLRSAEISELPLIAMRKANGEISDVIEVRSAKQRGRSRMRTLAMPPLIESALRDLLKAHPEATHAAFSIAADGSLRHQQASCVSNWFRRLYAAAGLLGCSSHSGRRTFATEMARNLSNYGCSLLDLKEAMGHRNLASTESYVEPSQGLHALVRAIGS